MLDETLLQGVHFPLHLRVVRAFLAAGGEVLKGVHQLPVAREVTRQEKHPKDRADVAHSAGLIWLIRPKHLCRCHPSIGESREHRQAKRLLAIQRRQEVERAAHEIADLR